MVNKATAMHEMIDKMSEQELERAYEFLKRFRRKGSSRKWVQPMPAATPLFGKVDNHKKRLH